MKGKVMDDYIIYDEQTQTYSMDPEQAVRDDVEKHHWKNTIKTILKDWRLYLMLVPLLFVFFCWRYLPMYELLGAFKYPVSNLPVAEQNYSGYAWFARILFADPARSITFWRAFRNTFLLSFYGLCFGFPMPIIVALFFNEIKSNIYRSGLQVLTYLPKFMSTVVMTTLTIMLLSSGVGSEPGVISQFLQWLGLVSEDAATKGLLNDPQYFRAIYQITGIWEGAGYDSIVYFAAIIAISPTSYEAAQIDGAGKMAQMRHVVLPSILSTLVIMLINRIGSLLSVGYEKVYLLYNTATWETADVVSTLAMRWGGIGGAGNDAGVIGQAMGSAAEMMNNLTGMILVIGANTIARKVSDVSLY